MKRLFLIGLFLGIYVIGFSQALAEEPVISIKATADRSSATIGDHIQLQIITKRRPEVKVLAPIQFKSEKFKVLKTSPVVPVEKKGFITEGKTYTVTTFDTGDFVLDSVKIEYLDTKGNRSILESNEVPISIKSVLTASAIDPRADIRDIKGVTGIQPQYKKYLPILYGSIGFIILSLIGLAIYSRQKKAISKVHYLLNPYDEAFARLKDLETSIPAIIHKIKPFYFELSNIVRHYLERNYGFSAEELTTVELEREISNLKLTKDTQDKLQSFFEDCDIVKFSPYLPTPDAILKDINTARSLVGICRTQISEPLASTPPPQNAL